jgi:hypothetical protein
MAEDEPQRTEGEVKLHAALVKERELHKAAKEALKIATARIAQHEALGDSPHADTVKGFIDGAVTAGVAAKSVELTQRVATLEAELAAARTAAETAAGNLAARTVADEVKEAARASHVLPTAIPDLLTLGRLELKLVDGQVVTEDGRTAEQWLDDSKSTRGHMWPLSRGAGSHGNSALTGLIETGPNPWAKGEGWSLTKQGEILTSQPERAAQLQRTAGN